jgi:hypothetical protein
MMNRLKSFAHTLTRPRTVTRLATIAVACLMLFAVAWWHNPFILTGPIYYTGKVFDADTNQPLEGAFVMALYVSHQSSAHGAITSCVKTKGMMTGKDGEFRFQVEKRNGTSPERVYAIKPDYYTVRHARMPDSIWQKQTQDSYSNRHIYLKRQDPKEPEFGGTADGCNSPAKPEDVNASIRYLELLQIEEHKYLPDLKSDAIQDQIDRMRQIAAESRPRK